MADNRASSDLPKYKLDLLFLGRICRLGKLLFPSLCSFSSLVFFLLALLSLLEQYVAYEVGILSSRFYKVLLGKNLDGFIRQCIVALGWITCISLVRAAKDYVTSILYLMWRQLLCVAIHRLYFSGDNYYQLNLIDNDVIDNPDQRMTQDVDKLCLGLSKIVPAVLVAPFIIAYYSYQAYINTGYIGPVGAFLLFLVSTILNKFLMSPIVGLTVEQEKREGNFRFKHMQVRVNAEALAFCGSGSLEYIKANNKLNELIGIQKRIVNWQFVLNAAVKLSDYVGSIISYVFLAIPLFTHKYDDLNAAELGALISMNGFVCIYLISAFSSLVDISVQVTDIAGNTHRVSDIIEKMVAYKRSNETDGYRVLPCADGREHLQTPIGCYEPSKIGFILENASFHPPKHPERNLINDMSVQLINGNNTLIMGKSSSGKTSILRVLRGLWPISSGSIVCRFPLGPSGVFFMSSAPFLTNGSLREQVFYPLRENDVDTALCEGTDKKILELLELVGLMNLEARTNGLATPVEWNWYDKLSPGEMQRLNFARMLFHHPVIAVMDEATSAVSVDVEQMLYEECCRRNITLISVGHRNSLRPYHQTLLELDGNGGWALKSL